MKILNVALLLIFGTLCLFSLWGCAALYRWARGEQVTRAAEQPVEGEVIAHFPVLSTSLTNDGIGGYERYVYVATAVAWPPGAPAGHRSWRQVEPTQLRHLVPAPANLGHLSEADANRDPAVQAEIRRVLDTAAREADRRMPTGTRGPGCR